MSRDPEFIIVGTMKSGTTALFRWLQQASGSILCREKEPEFFLTGDGPGSRAHRRYRSLFPTEGLAGEASVAYSDPQVASEVAARIAEVCPSVRLICVLREPETRLRSHYRHEVHHGRERRPFLQAVSEPDNPYVRRSLYDLALAPFLERFGTESLLVVQMEHLVDGEHPAWSEVLAFLGLPPSPHPRIAVNVTADKPDYTPLMRRLYDSRLLRRLEPVTPRAIRKLVRPLLLRRDPVAERLRAESRDLPLPGSVTARLDASVRNLSELTSLDLAAWGRRL